MERLLPAASDPSVDVAIVTVLKEEYEAVKATLSNVQRAPERPGFPNLFSWCLGTLQCASGGQLRVVVALVAQPGNVPASIATLRTIDRWKPRYLLFSGIAGGLDKDGIVEGDVVVSTYIWHYEHGKIEEGRFNPRHRYTWRADVGLLNSAVGFNVGSHVWAKCGVAPPRTGHIPKVVPGAIARK
jgi:nucleoside phosphorylase